MSGTFLQARGLTWTVGNTAIVDSLDLAVERGELVGVIGPNGAGKTTLLRLLAGVLTPTAGEVLRSGGNDRGRLPLHDREGVEFLDLEKTLTELFAEFSKGAFVKAAIPEVLKGMAKGARVEAVLKVYRLQKISGSDLERIVEECNHDLKAVMQKYRLQVDPQEVSLLIALKKKGGHPHAK
jgi:ABC-type multidrug transport system ATPase subunit